jgi:hypothetical protein
VYPLGGDAAAIQYESKTYEEYQKAITEIGNGIVGGIPFALARNPKNDPLKYRMGRVLQTSRDKVSGRTREFQNHKQQENRVSLPLGRHHQV